MPEKVDNVMHLETC
jgi:hypothetical protein